MDLSTHFKANESNMIFGGLTWTNYGVNEAFELETSGGSTFVAAFNGAEIPQEWQDQINIRLAWENSSFDMPIRLGYVYTTPVTDDENASANLLHARSRTHPCGWEWD